MMKLLKHPLISGSVIIFVGSFLANVLNFFFNLFVIKHLTKVDYGTLQTIIAIITLPGIAAGAILPLIVNFGGKYFSQKEFEKIRGLYYKIIRFFLSSGAIFFIVFLLFIPLIAAFFHIDNYFILFLADIFILFTFFNTTNTAFLQAKLDFKFITFTVFLGSSLKLILGIAFFLLGFSVNGAVGALVVSMIIPYFLTFIPLKFLFIRKSKNIKIPTKELLTYGVPSAITVLGLTSLISMDIILAKHFFDPNEGGDYAGLSLMGRVLFFFTAPIGTVMFPLLVQKYEKKENLQGTFILSVLLVAIPSCLLTVIYFLFPHFIISIFTKSDYFILAPYVGLFAVFTTLFSITSLFVNFYLAIKKVKIFIPTVVAAVLQIIGICLFHENIIQIVYTSLIVTFLLLLTLLLYYPYATRK